MPRLMSAVSHSFTVKWRSPPNNSFSAGSRDMSTGNSVGQGVHGGQPEALNVAEKDQTGCMGQVGGNLPVRHIALVVDIRGVTDQLAAHSSCQPRGPLSLPRRISLWPLL
jgi:hypothetical protein